MPIQEKFLQPLIVIMMAGGLLAGTWHLAAAYESMKVQNGGSITGVVKLNGAAPPVAQLEITRDQKVCGSGAKASEALVVSPPPSRWLVVTPSVPRKSLRKRPRPM